MSKTNINPIAGYLVVEPKQKEQTTQSGIVLPDSHDEKPQEGKVLAVGADFTTDYGTKKSAPCKTGDTVVYREWGGKEYKNGDRQLLILKFDDIMAILK
ncbi:co-chaperone GroES [Patescibacteria group bacterium]|nr:co-chaperone GroES [Patescibacteria group bacterium]MCG2702738.1 co-chaperone GroES [Candidatus Parcubacteria bacterium]MBU4265438.1 co-chaperone GroES [Patescibacteria group bacterium]MBU4390488.1 co-chaperone GroES [Patescibacteria group bacterium]MBU4397055.1 co-chaperone GroES [Patescibacteria group bacterium]